jgi:DNA repair exonuclease SbcCD nuclease subunit
MAKSFIHIGDPHLRRYVWSNRPEICGDAYHAFDYAIGKCIELGANAVVPGDLFNSPHPDPDDVRFFSTQVKRLQDAGLSYFFLDGNHDGRDGNIPWPSLVDGVTHVDRQRFHPCDGILAYGLDYRPAAALEKELANVPPDAEVLFGHQLLDLAFAKEGAFNMRSEWVPSSVKAVFLSDYHVTWDAADDRGIRFYYPGSICMQSLGEPPEKFLYHVTRGDAGSLNVSKIRIPTRQFYFCRIQDAAELEKFVGGIGPHIDLMLEDKSPGRAADVKPIIRVKYATDIPGAHQRIASAIGDKAHAFIQPEPAEAVVAAGSSTVQSPSEVLATLVNPDMNREVFDFTLGLIGTSDVRSYLAEVRKTIGVGVATVATPVAA